MSIFSLASGRSGRCPPLLPSNASLLAALACLAGACDLNSVARTDQAFGEFLGVDAWLDPALQPMRGCDALEGEWSNRGNRVRNYGIEDSVFAAVAGLADRQPESVFADRVRLARETNGAISATFIEDGRPVAIVDLPASQLGCQSPAYAQVGGRHPHRLSVDADGALWADEHRFRPLSEPACPKVGFWTQSAPAGLASVVPGGAAMLLDPEQPGQPILTHEAIHGVRVPPQAVFLLPREQRIAARVWLKPKSQMQLRVPSLDTELVASLETCHVYAVFGEALSTDRARVSLVDLGPDFDWRDCPLSADSERAAAHLVDGELELREACFRGFTGEGWKTRMRRRPIVAQIELSTSAKAATETPR